jgi:hypothetical protein
MVAIFVVMVAIRVAGAGKPLVVSEKFLALLAFLAIGGNPRFLVRPGG